MPKYLYEYTVLAAIYIEAENDAQAGRLADKVYVGSVTMRDPVNSNQELPAWSVAALPGQRFIRKEG